jgi:hypothetical protein
VVVCETKPIRKAPEGVGGEEAVPAEEKMFE